MKETTLFGMSAVSKVYRI